MKEILYFCKIAEKFLLPFQPNLIIGKSFSEALILATVNPQYDKRLFVEFSKKYKLGTNCV